MAIENFNEKLNKVLSDKESGFMDEAAWKIENERWLHHAAEIALSILDALEERDWSKEDLAEKTNIPLEDINDMVKGKADLSLSTISKLEKALDYKLISV